MYKKSIVKIKKYKQYALYGPENISQPYSLHHYDKCQSELAIQRKQ